MFLPTIVAFEYLVKNPAETLTPLQRMLRCWPFAVVAALYLALRIALFGKLAPVLQHPQVSWPEAVYSGFSLTFAYLKLLLWPSSLSAFHVFHATHSLSELRAVAGLTVFVALCCGFLILRKRAPTAPFCLFWTAITLLPVLNARWMAANVLTERYLYLPSAGFCWFFAWSAFALVRLAQKTTSFSKFVPAVVSACLGVICLVGVTATIARNKDWSDDRTLYNQTLATDPHAYPILLNLALTYQQERNPAKAEEIYKQALAERPDGVNVLNNLGILYFEQQRFAESTEMLKKAIAVKPLWAEPHYNYGRLLEKQGDSEGALKELRLATQLAPLNAAAHLYYADSLLSAGELAQAASEYERSIGLGPSLEAEQGLADIYIRTGNRSGAEAMLRRVIAESPYDGSSHLSMAQLLEQDGRFSEALSEYRKVLETNPNSAQAQSAIGRLRESAAKPER